ncbi:putative serine/threonine-protein kinase [Kocuria dechangensis]|uniref:non-specific serine/threonine protein kinase n=1 Tax=Kocuria dechangensis TaxID=1176249 RepID=A0A917H0E9_9MICC|nr:Stk1 family PASTA domain-containing Ser/Thr kinase [Kocuria dechangensis]GGG63395.1 putative serine/threonine-protein kinase [Kocuria dechangensis]
MPGRYPVPRLINDRYEVGETIGRGGMATVHLGRDLRLGRRVAIKVLRPELARDATFHERFKREAQSVAALNHHSIVSVYDTGEIPAETEEGVDRPFIVMEHVPGRTLRELIHEDAITPQEAVDVTLGILDALEYSHRAGIVHRDIKPANVIVTPDRRIKVMDFGIARAVEDTSPALTQAQAVLGTAQYLSPEQARGESVDARSDLYSAACVLFEMLTGRTPFVGGTSVDVAAQHVRDRPPAPSELDPRLGGRVDAFMARALAKDPADRFQDAGQMRRALRELRPAVPGELDATQPLHPVAARDEDTKTLPPVAAVPAAGPPPSAVPVPGPAAESTGASPAARRRRHPARTALLGLLVLAVLAVVGVVGVQLVQAERDRPVLVAVPHVSGMDASVAETSVRNAELVPQREEVFSDDVPDGNVVATDPAADTQVEAGSTVLLEVSKGPEEVEVPADLVGLSEEDARDALEDAGLEAGSTRTGNSAWAPEGTVIGTDPSSGTTVPTGSDVALVLSTGRVTVPQLVGLTRDEAVAALGADDVRLAYEVVTTPRSVVEPGQVVDQSVEAGQSAPQGSTVTLTVAVAPAPAPTARPTTPAPTRSATPSPTSSPEPSPRETTSRATPSARPSATPTPEEEPAAAEDAEDAGNDAGADARNDEGNNDEGNNAAENAGDDAGRGAGRGDDEG